MKRNLTVVAVVLLMLVVAAAGCVAKLKEADVRYAGPMVDNLLAGIAAGDYAGFSRDLDDTMLKAIDEKAFTAMVDQIRSVIGDYQSKTFTQAVNTTENNVPMTVIIYKARFSNEPADVLITVTFTDSHSGKKISGLFFNSPKLRGQ